MGSKGKDPTVKRRKNSEKRKLKSRDAARCRRSKESEIFKEMNELIPLSYEVTDHLDKSASIRLLIAYIHLKNFLLNVSGELLLRRSNNNVFSGSLCLQTLDGFILILSTSGDITYLSDNVKMFLGISSNDMLGHRLCDFCHPCDHHEIEELFASSVEELQLKTFHCPIEPRFLRMKCILTNRERKLTMKSAAFKVMKFTGHLFCFEKPSIKSEDSVPTSKMSRRFVTVVTPIPHPSNIEFLLDQKTFVSRHSLDMKFTYVDERIQELLNYNKIDVLDTSIYSCIHTADIRQISKLFKDLFVKGQCETGRYRFLHKNGGYVWMVTQATVIYDGTKSEHPQCVVCIHYIISEVVDRDLIFSVDQISKKSGIDSVPVCVSRPPVLIIPESHVPLQSTDTIFAPRTNDMNTGFLSLEDTGAVLHSEMKDDSDDLTHLAPTPGDACVPLEISNIDDDILDGLFLANSGISETSMPSLSSETSSLISDHAYSPLKNDPFMSYRDEASPLDDNRNSAELLKPYSVMSNEEINDQPAILDESRSLTDDSSYTLPLGDFPSLSVTDPVLWNSCEPSPVLNPESFEDTRLLKSSSLAELLQSSQTNSIRGAAAAKKYMEFGKHFIRCHDPGGNDVSRKKNRYCSPAPKHLLKKNQETTPPLLEIGSHELPDKNCFCSRFVEGDILRSVEKSVLCDCDKSRSTNSEEYNLKRHHFDTKENDVQACKKQRINKDVSQSSGGKDSVLMSLLVNGQDRRNGYKCPEDLLAPKNQPKRANKLFEIQEGCATLAQLLMSDTADGYDGSIKQFMNLTREDAEVNAPTSSGLLRGTELLHALDERNASLKQVFASG